MSDNQMVNLRCIAISKHGRLFVAGGTYLNVELKPNSNDTVGGTLGIRNENNKLNYVPYKLTPNGIYVNGYLFKVLLTADANSKKLLTEAYDKLKV